MKPDTLMIDDVKYVRADSVEQLAPKVEGLEAVLIRTFSAGVHFGYLKQRQGKEVTLVKARRVFYWDGAASLSQMATEGVKAPENCKFSVIVPEILLTEAIEVIKILSPALSNLYAVPVWKR
jgi:hypothetical protein